jgi:hypothetical protein
MIALRRPDVWAAADLAFRRAVEQVWGLEPPALVEQVGALGQRVAHARRRVPLLEHRVLSRYARSTRAVIDCPTSGYGAGSVFRTRPIAVQRVGSMRGLFRGAPLVGQ